MYNNRLKIFNGYAYGADAHGEVKYNCWEKPTQIAQWKEEHVCLAVLLSSLIDVLSINECMNSHLT